MKRVILAFVGTLVGGFVLFAVVNHFRPVPDPGMVGEVIGGLAVLFAIAAGLDEMKRRAAKRAGAGCPRDTTAALQAARAGKVRGAEPVTDAEEDQVVFRPYRKPMLIVALLLAGMAAVYILAVGVREPVWLFRAVRIPGPLAVGASLFAAALYLGFFIRSHLPGREIIVDTSGIVLPRRRRVTWDQITEVKLCNADYIELLATVRIGLDDGHRIRLVWHQIGCEPRKLYEVIQAYSEEHERRAELRRRSTEQQDDPVFTRLSKGF